MASRKRHHSGQQQSAPTVTPTYTTLASLRDKLRSSKKADRNAACKQLLEKLQDTSTIKRLEFEAQLMFDTSIRRGGGSGTSLTTSGTLIGENSSLYPRDRVSLLYRNLMESALIAAQTLIDGETGSSTKHKRTAVANQTGLIKKSLKFTIHDILFPYKVFLKIDNNVGTKSSLEVNDGGYTSCPSWDVDWKSRPRYCHHLATRNTSTSSSSSNDVTENHGVFSATYYTPHNYTDEDRGTRLSSKEIIGCVDYCIQYLNDGDCIQLAEPELLTWLGQICSRVDYVAELPMYHQVSHILDEIGRRIGRAFHEENAIRQESLVAAAKCLSGLIYNCTTRLGMGMQLYVRPVIEMVGIWAAKVWGRESGVGVNGGALRSETDIGALMPYLYSAVTHLLAAHPEQSIAVLSEHGHALLRLARRNYTRLTTSQSTRDALTDYIAAHLLVAETSGKLCGLPEGDLGPLEPRDEEENPGDDDEDDNDEEDPSLRKKQQMKKKRRNGATLDGKTILSLLDMIRNEKVWEALFASNDDGGKKRRKKSSRRSFPGGKHGKGGGKKSPSLAEGGATWTTLNRRQRRYLELLARLIRVSQRLYLSEAEDVKEGAMDSLEMLVMQANDMRDQPSIEKGEIEIEKVDHSQSQSTASPESLASSPWIRMVCRHLYNLNPKLGKLVQSGSNLDQDMGASQFFTQHNASSDNAPKERKDDMASMERFLFESCPMLQSLTVETEEEAPLAEPTTTYTASTFTQSTSFLGKEKAMKGHDTIRPTAVATLQLLCASAESFPRGECWSSSARNFWSTILDERHYPNGTSANILERYGSSPADAATVVYLLGTTLESHGWTGGDESVQLWTLMALLKMTESSAIICSREGLDTASSFGSPSSLKILRVAWQYVWKILFRYDLRYTAYTQGAYDSNAGELVLQLLTQMIRYNCADRSTMMSTCSPSRLLAKDSPSSSSSFVHAEQERIRKLPIFDDTSTILSSAPFELITAIIERVGFSGTVGSSDDNANTDSPRDLNYFLCFCLRFFESSMVDAPESHIQRSLFPFVSMCLAAIIGDGGFVTSSSTYELDGLTRFGVTEDIEPIFYSYDPDGSNLHLSSTSHWLIDALWSESIGYDRVKDVDSGCTRRILHGRGTLLNKFLNARYEREKLWLHQQGGGEFNLDTSNSAFKLQLGHMVLQKLKSSFDAKVFQVKYDGENSSDEENDGDNAPVGNHKPLVLPQLTGYLSIILTAIISKNLTHEAIAKDISDVFKDTFMPTFDIILASLPSIACHPADRVAVLNHLNGIVRVLVKISAVEKGGGSSIPQLFEDQAKSFFKMCKFMLKEHRKETYTSPLSPTLPNNGRSRQGYESDDDVIQAPTQRHTTSYAFQEDSDGMMDDDDDDMHIMRSTRDRVQHLPSKRRRVGNISSRNTKKDSSQLNNKQTYIDAPTAFSVASLMVLLQPSFECLELIAGHIVWPDEYDSEAGYIPISKSPDPYCALVCASLLCQRSVILRRDRLAPSFSAIDDANGSSDDDQASALILCADIIFQARRWSTPSSKYFMCGLGIAASLVEIREYGDCCRPINPAESKAILDMLHQEGVEGDNEDYRKVRQWKKILKLKSSYNTEKLRCATLVFLFAKTSLHRAIDDSFSTHFVKAGLRNIDEFVREFASDAVGAVLDSYTDSGQIVSEIERCLPKIYNPKKFERWRESVSDPKLPDNLTEQDQIALDDAATSFEYYYVETIGLMAGASKDAAISRDMVWKLIELASRIPELSLLCLRALKRASFLLGYNKLNDLLDETMPHLLVKWLDTRRSLHDIPLLVTSPFALEKTCRYFPVDISSMLLQKDGWDDGYFTFVDTSETLKQRVFHSFVHSVTDFLIPSILLSASEEDFDTMKYLSECALILTEAASDESIAKILRNEIAAICGYIFIFYDSLPNESDSAMEMFKRCVSSKHIEKDGAKNAHRVLRHMLVLRRRGVSVVGNPELDLDPKTFIDGMKMISKQLQKTSRSGGNASFLEYAGSSMTECIVIAKYWLSSSVTDRQREDSWRVFELLCTILKENLHDETISCSELNFALNAFINVVLDEDNNKILPSTLTSLKSVLESLFHESTKTALIDGVLPTLRKLCLALLQLHERTLLSFYSKCNASLSSLEFEQKASQGLLPGDPDSMDESLGGSTADPLSKRQELLKHLIESKVAVEATYDETTTRSFECVEMMAKSGKMSLEDILGAHDLAFQLKSERNEDLFCEVNQRYSMASLFSSIQKEDSDAIPSLHDEAQHFLKIMDEYPISIDLSRANIATAGTAVLQSIEARARLLALRRLENSLMRQDSSKTSIELPIEVHEWLIKICYSLDPEDSRLISSRCLGEINSLSNVTDLTMPNHSTPIQSLLAKHDGRPYLLIMTNILTSVGKFLVSGCAETSLVAMKTARALLSTGAGKECWKILSNKDRELFRPFAINDEGQQHNSVLISDSCKEKLRSRAARQGVNHFWCFSDGLWNLDEYDDDSRDLWIRNVVCAIISCCLGKESKVRNRGFFRICQGMCAKEASFAAEMFPYLIFSLLDADPSERSDGEKSASARDLILSQTTIGTATSRMNDFITKCFSKLLCLNADQMKTNPLAVNSILSALEWLKSITEHRFLVADHKRNGVVHLSKKSKGTSKRRRSKATEVDDIRPAPQWRGCSHGVVLRLDGVDVARACFYMKRYFSAIYYAETGMQNLIGHGNFFEQLSGDYSHKFDRSDGLIRDISGFGIPSQNDGHSVLDRALVAKDIIARCLSELEAKDELNGILSQGAALSLKQNITSLDTLEGLRTEKLAALQDHDIQLEETPLISHQGLEAISGCLEDLGLNHTKHHYLIGVQKTLTDDQKDKDSIKFLREKWFEDSLNKVSRWDDSLLPKTNGAEPLVHSDKIGEVPFFQENVSGGFYESVNHALSSLTKGDIVGGLSNITHARRSVLADMESLVGSESQLKGMATHLSRLSVIGNFELTARTLEGNSPASFLLSRWGFRNEAGVVKLESLLMESDQYSFDMESNGNEVDTNLTRRVSTEFSVQETLLKLLISKCEPEQGDIVEALTSHVFKSCHIYRDLGRADSASLSLTRLRSLVQIFQERGTTYSPNLPMILRLEDAKLLKCQNDLDKAVMHCKIISSHLSSPEDVETNIERDSLLADSLLLGSLWMAEQNVDTAASILSSFQKASHLSIKVHKKAKAMGASHSASSIRKASIAGFKLGEFAASLYHSVETRMSSEAWKKRCSAASERKKEFDMAVKEEQKVRKKKSRSNADEKVLYDLNVVKCTLEKEIDMDEREIGSVKDTLRQYLRMSVESYCAALRLCPTSVAANVSKHVFQLVSLWFKNCLRAETNDIVNGLMRENVLSIPSYRFVPLTYQLFSRIESVEEIGGNDFQNILRDMVLKICTEHPYHGIVQLIALANGKRIGSGVNGRNADAYLENVGGSKVDAASSILDDLRKCEKEYIPALVESYTTLADAFIELAMFSTSAWDKKPAIGLSFSQLKLSLDSCFSSGRRGSKNTSAANKPVIFTNPPPIQPNAQYGDGKEDPIGAERVLGFESKFDLTPTGIHRPKIVKCIGSKGGRYTQLVKGLDDLRQDAIMEQVFGTVNDLLRHEGAGGNNMIKQTLGTSAIPRSSRHLRLITYGITPLSPAAGVLEWVNDTMCIGDYLEDKRGNLGAHSRYNPGEWGSSDCGGIYGQVAENHAPDLELRRRTYRKICENFSPAFRFFFLEYFNSSMEAWHTARTAYTRSCAVNSIVGHILGIGDRHLSNILVNTKTGEVVHIDFGFVFEQGKTLSVPELVPFRLTRDIVDGMGPSGTDGVFFKAAEETLTVLRNNSDTLLTILSAVVSDPLYKWSISPQKARELQQQKESKEEEEEEEDDGEAKSKEGTLSSRPSLAPFNAEDGENKSDAAARAISKITSKLQGYEDSSAFDKSVAGQVKLLINEARDPDNLGLMFRGWSPWL